MPYIHKEILTTIVNIVCLVSQNRKYEMIDELLVKTNKTITRLRYEDNFKPNKEIDEVLDLLQHHLFLVHTFFDKSEISASDIKIRLTEKINKESK